MPAPSPHHEFCPSWPLTWTEAAACASDAPDVDEADQQGFLDDAAEFLWRRTGRQYGRCTETVTRTLTHCCTHGVGCHCAGAGTRLDVPLTPIISITDVTDDDVAQVEGVDFEIVNRRTLRRLVGVWSRWAEISMTVVYGQDPPGELERAQATLAVEFAKWCAGAECAFDANTERVSAEGMSILISKPSLWPISGIDSVDKAINGVWPYGTGVPPGGADPGVCDPNGWDIATPSEEAS